jgi:urease subunit alpha
MRAFFGGLGEAPRHLSAQFAAESVLSDSRLGRELPPGVRYLPVSGARGLTRADMVLNGYVPHVIVPPGDEPVLVDGAVVPVHEADSLPLTRLHYLG